MLNLLLTLPLPYVIGMAVWIGCEMVMLVALLKWRRSRKRLELGVWPTNLGLSLWMLLALLTLPELGTALFYDQTDSFSKTNVSRRWYDLHVAANTDGYRDTHPLPTERRADQQSILFMGDSFTFGHGVKDPADRFSDRVAAALERRAPGQSLVSNASLPGLDIKVAVDQELPDHLAAGHVIDTLIYMFVPNDIEYLDERTAEFYRQLGSFDPQNPLWKDTYFYNLMYYRLQQLTQRGKGSYYDYLADSYAGPPWERLTIKLDQLHQLCETNGIELKIVLFPFLHNLGESPAMEAAYEKVSRYCSDREIPFLNLSEVLRSHADEGLVVNRMDAHPNERAHRLAAEAIIEEWYGGSRANRPTRE